jgi:nucleoside-diphosphate-sugar epimerase
MEFVIIRPPLVYGPQAPGNFGKLLHAVKSRKWLPFGRVNNLRSLIGLDNLLHFIELCARHPAARNQIYLVSDGEDVSTPGLIRRIATALRQPDRLLNLPLPVLRLIAGLAGRGDQIDRLVSSLQVDSTKARTQLGWAPPVSLDEGLASAVRDTKSSKPPT